MPWNTLYESQLSTWMENIPEKERAIYVRVLSICHKRGLQFALGGAAALGIYTGHWRNTKDLDLYILPSDRDRIVEIFAEAGLQDYFCVASYDRRWIYRAWCNEAIVDAIWAMANQRAEVDELWLTRGPLAPALDGISVRILPPEEMIWSKLYVMQRERCDWPDILNLLYATARHVDWDHLISRVGDDTPLLRALVDIFHWLCPTEDISLAEALLDARSPRISNNGCSTSTRRADLLDSRPWFGPRLVTA